MTLEDYKVVCKKFRDDSMEWGACDTYKFYTATDCFNWVESCDNNNGGIDVSWAFHLSDEKIEQCALQEWWYNLEIALQTIADYAEDDSFDKEWVLGVLSNFMD